MILWTDGRSRQKKSCRRYLENQGEADKEVEHTMVYEQAKVNELAKKIKAFMRENHMVSGYLERVQGDLAAGMPIPDIETAVDNGRLRFMLDCYLCHMVSKMQESEQKKYGRKLIDELEKIEIVPKKKTGTGMKQVVWEVAELLKELDGFKYAEYMEVGDMETDTVRRIYTDLMVPEKRLALSNYLQSFSGTVQGERISEVVAFLQEAGKAREAEKT